MVVDTYNPNTWKKKRRKTQGLPGLYSETPCQTGRPVSCWAVAEDLTRGRSLGHRVSAQGSCYLPRNPATQHSQSGDMESHRLQSSSCCPEHVLGSRGNAFSPPPLYILLCRSPSVTSSSTSQASCCGTHCPAHACPSAWPRPWANAPPSTAGLPSSTSSCASCFCPHWCLASPWQVGRPWWVWGHPSGPCWPLWCSLMSCRTEVLGTYPSGCRHGTSCPVGCTLCSPWMA